MYLKQLVLLSHAAAAAVITLAMLPADGVQTMIMSLLANSSIMWTSSRYGCPSLVQCWT